MYLLFLFHQNHAYRSSNLVNFGKTAKNIYGFWHSNFGFWVWKKSDKIGLFAGNIFFIALIWSEWEMLPFPASGIPSARFATELQTWTKFFRSSIMLLFFVIFFNRFMVFIEKIWFTSTELKPRKKGNECSLPFLRGLSEKICKERSDGLAIVRTRSTLVFRNSLSAIASLPE